jgi:hypothetical protein
MVGFLQTGGTMLYYALHGGVPLIALQTTDTIHCVPFLISQFGPAYSFEGVVASERLYYAFGTIPGKDPPRVLIPKLEKASSVLVVFNPDDAIPEAFDAGVLHYPKEFIVTAVQQSQGVKIPEEVVRGITPKQAIELTKILLSKSPVLSAHGFMELRAKILGTKKGLFLVDTTLQFYHPIERVEEWLARNSQFFMGGYDPRLVPRGLLFNGMPGTGKTLAAKRIAEVLGVPLYRLDLSSSMSKWHGESESNLAHALASVDQESPCVMLLDEVEKLFANNTEEVTSRLLAQLLWWLQEHTSKVLTIMTTNNLDGLPPEIYRSGRIDKTVHIGPLSILDANEMARSLIRTFNLAPKVSASILKEVVSKIPGITDGLTPAQVTSVTYEAIKNSLVVVSKKS